MVETVALKASIAILVVAFVMPASSIATFQPRNAVPPATSALVPSRGALWGAWVAPVGGQSDAQAVASLEATAQRNLDVVHQYHAWDEAWPTATESSWAGGGRIIFGNASARQTSGAVLTWSAIASGSQDSVIHTMASRLRAFGHQLFFSFDEEPEDRYHSNPTAYPLASYVAAYRRIHDLFAADGATNVVWVWNVSGYIGNASIYPSLYPGDAYVDWIGWDPYNWFNCPVNTTNVWQSFDTIVAPFYNWVAAGNLGGTSAAKPYMLAEYGTVENTGSPTKGQWFTSEVSTLPGRPNIKAVVYFDENKDCNWPITTSTDSINGFRTAGMNCYVNRSASCGSNSPPPTAPPSTAPPPPASPAASPTTSQPAGHSSSTPHSSSGASHSPSTSHAPGSGTTPKGPAATPSQTTQLASPVRTANPMSDWLLAHEYLVPIAVAFLIGVGLVMQRGLPRGR